MPMEPQSKTPVQTSAPPKLEPAKKHTVSVTDGVDYDPHRGQGGCFAIDPKTGIRVRVKE